MNYCYFTSILKYIIITGPKWKNDRKLISPLLTYKKITQFFGICKEQSDALITHLEKHANGKTFDVEKYLHRAAAEIVNGK